MKAIEKMIAWIRQPDESPVMRCKSQWAALGLKIKAAEEEMKRKPPSGKFLLEDGDLICRECRYPDDELEKELLIGDTYADDPCDRCGK